MIWLWILLVAKPYYTGYAGSPVSSGSCAASCHGNGTFSVNVTGFPSTYTPGDTYEITISALGGSIKNFNACVLDENNHPQGTLQGGTYTGTYSHSGEGTGVHGTTYDHTSYSFFWTAPSQPVGVVKLYVAAHRGGHSGPNFSTVLTSSPLSVAEGASGGTPSIADVPSVAQGPLTVVLYPSRHPVEVTILSVDGAMLHHWDFSTLTHSQTLQWNPPSGGATGVYWVTIRSGRSFLRRPVIYLRR